MKSPLVQQMQALGFREKEAAIYVVLLTHGPATVAELGKKCSIQRTTIYDIINELEQIGLVSRVSEVKKRTYRAESPEKIPIIMEARAAKYKERARHAQNMMGAFLAAGTRHVSVPKVTVFEGDAGIKSLYNASLLCKTYLRSFLTADTLETFDPDYIHTYFQRRAAKGIRIQGILNNSQQSIGYKRLSKKLLRDVRIVPQEKMDVVPEIYIYDDTVAIFSLKEGVAVSIESKDVAHAFKKLYDLAWERAGEYDTVLDPPPITDKKRLRKK